MTTSRKLVRVLLAFAVTVGGLAATPRSAPAAEVEAAELTPQAAAAIDKALSYLARTQQADGSWSEHYPVGVTALALMAFMVKGNFPGEEPYGDEMGKGLDYLLREARAGEGYLGSNMYSHALATLVFSELWGMTERDDEIRQALKAAVDIICNAQNEQGGWRYHPRPSGADVSSTVMQIVALASAQQAGILVPNNIVEKATKYVRLCWHVASGGFGYMPYGNPGFARSAAGVYALMLCGERESETIESGIRYLHAVPQAVFDGGEYYYYGHYYAIQVMYQAGDEHYHPWYARIRESLLRKQRAGGGWPPAEGGEGQTTAMAVIVLGAPYRFIPIYQE